MALEVGEVSISAAGGKMVNSGGDGESGEELLGPEKTQSITCFVRSFVAIRS